ncbi:FG-GAP repeat domain-containing protein [Planctomycetaceae bacterium SH139]
MRKSQIVSDSSQPSRNYRAAALDLIASTLIALSLLSLQLGCRRDANRPAEPNPEPAAAASAPLEPEQKTPPLSLGQTASGQTASGETTSGPASQPAAPPSPISFAIVGAERGLDFRRYEDIRGHCRIFESTGGGVAMIDIDSDGLLDLMFTDGCRLPVPAGAGEAPLAAPATPASDRQTGGKLFRNLGAMRFAEITSQSCIQQTGLGQGCAVGDIDGDGFDDLYITSFGDNQLWRNNGDGTFSDVTERAGANVSSWSTSCAFADVNLDGHLDLYVANYLVDSLENPLLCPASDSPSGYTQCPPSKYAGVDDVLLLNDGQGGFLDQSEAAGLRGQENKALGVVIANFDNHGLPEIFVANDGQANGLLVATAQPKNATTATNFTLRYDDQGLTSGVALSRSGYAQASMGVAHGDIDGDGFSDLILTHFYSDSNTVYRNMGDLRFDDVTRRSGLAGPSRQVLGWGTVLEDFDGDGQLDLFVSNGHVEDRHWLKHPEPFAMPAQLFINRGKGRLQDISHGAGEFFQNFWKGRGVAAGDLDGDGRIDLAISHLLEPAVVLWNQTELAAGVERGTVCRFVGLDSNRSGIGVRVELFDKNGISVSTREIIGGGSFLSASAQQLIIRPSTEIAKLRIHWPGGESEEHPLPRDGTALFLEQRGHFAL